MNYYDETLTRIRECVLNGDKEKAIGIIENELKAPYLPREFEDEIRRIYEEIKPSRSSFKIDDDDLCEYLKGSKEKQLIAVDQMDKKNLREYIGLCNEYLCSDGFINAKVLLVDSLIRQEIGDEIRMENEGMEYEFIPKYLLPVEESDGYISGRQHINETFLKEPSKAKIALDLLYKEMILSLPVNMNEEEGIIIAGQIIEYVNKAFEA